MDKRLVILVIIIFAAGCRKESATPVAEPGSFLLSWQGDPTTTMTVDWHPEPGTNVWMEYREQGSAQWQVPTARKKQVTGMDRFLLRTELTSLKPDHNYEFRFSGDDPVYRFRTMPQTLERPIRFIAAADIMHHRQWMEITAESAMKVAGDDLDFAVIGGDLAYGDAVVRKAFRWFDYFEAWSGIMITDDRRVIPHLAAIGNHEVKNHFVYNYPVSRYSQEDFARTEAPYFTTFIPLPGEKGYDLLDFGDYLTLFLLDSGHLNPIAGKQANWLADALRSRSGVRHLLPVYHVAAYPSARNFDGFLQTEIREHWVPLFEKHGVRLAMEYHDHTFKLSHPIRNNQVDETGIYYVGDGGWGTNVRNPRTDEHGNLPWYIANADSVRNFSIVEIRDDLIQVDMYNDQGGRLDQLIIPDAGR